MQINFSVPYLPVNIVMDSDNKMAVFRLTGNINSFTDVVKDVTMLFDSKGVTYTKGHVQYDIPYNVPFSYTGESREYIRHVFEQVQNRQFHL